MDNEFNNHENNKKKETGLTVLVVILIIGFAAILIAILFKDTLKNSVQSTTGTTQITNKKHFFAKNNKYIAELKIEGTIQESNKTYNQQWLLSTIQQLAEDTNNEGIILFINSPGGAVYQADEVYLALQDYKKTGKPLYAYLGPIAASGGYYIACAATDICANRNTLTGSIGVISGPYLDATELLKKLGINSYSITAGKNKNMLNFNSKPTEEQKNIMQSVINESYNQFVTIVANSRNKDISTIKKLADGRIYTAHQAVSKGLINRIGTLDQEKRQMEITKLGKTDYDLKVFAFKYNPSIFDFLTSTFSSTKQTEAVNTIINKFMPEIQYPAYLYTGY